MFIWSQDTVLLVAYKLSMNIVKMLTHRIFLDGYLIIKKSAFYVLFDSILHNSPKASWLIFNFSKTHHWLSTRFLKIFNTKLHFYYLNYLFEIKYFSFLIFSEHSECCMPCYLMFLYCHPLFSTQKRKACVDR